jgi:hypothetical protein
MWWFFYVHRGLQLSLSGEGASPQSRENISLFLKAFPDRILVIVIRHAHSSERPLPACVNLTLAVGP